MRRVIAGWLAATGLVLAAGAVVRADIIMSSAGLNTTLKTLELLKRDVETGPARQRPESVFQLAVEAHGLADLMNEEVLAHGMSEKALLDLAIARTKELDIVIAYNRDKKKFFYDDAAFERYLKEEPAGIHAAAAEYALLNDQFYQLTGEDPAAVLAAATAKQRFLAKYPTFKGNAELSLLLAIDYRDLYRHAIETADAAGATKYRQLTRRQYQRVARVYPNTEPGAAAVKLLQRFDQELAASRKP